MSCAVGIRDEELANDEIDVTLSRATQQTHRWVYLDVRRRETEGMQREYIREISFHPPYILNTYKDRFESLARHFPNVLHSRNPRATFFIVLSSFFTAPSPLQLESTFSKYRKNELYLKIVGKTGDYRFFPKYQPLLFFTKLKAELSAYFRNERCSKK